jgi:dTDP-4-dehydrorhamnose 3,5-epimerase
MQVTTLKIPEVKLIVPKSFEDRRGIFSEIYNARLMADAGIIDVFVQDNLSLSTEVGTIRGLHFQTPPFAQAKLVRVGRGRILDVAVDIRRSSPTYGKHVSAELSHENRVQIYVPIGFAHGFCTLEPNTEVVHKVSNFYAPQADAGVLWSDSDLEIDWPVRPEKVIVSEKDARLPLLKTIEKCF